MILTREETKEYVKAHLDIRRHLTKARKGGYICISCGNGSGSDGTGAKYYPDSNSCSCHKCGEEHGQQAFHFDVLDAIQHEYSCDFNTALQIGADELGIVIDNSCSSSDTAGKPKVKNTEPQQAQKPALNLTAYYDECAKRLQASTEALSYLLARGINAEAAARYNLGYDPCCDISGKGYIEPRVIVPVNETCYVGRSIDPGSDFPKPFNAGCTITPFNAAALYRDSKAVFIVEGWADAISIELCGGAAVAINSANHTQKLLDLLEKNPTTATLIICLDNDKAGKEAVSKLETGFKRLQLQYVIEDVAHPYKDASAALEADKDNLRKNVARITEKAVQTPQDAVEQQEEPQPDYLTSFFEKIQTEAYKPYSTGLGFFDNMLNGGVMRQTLLLLMAAPGAGKTTLCQQIAEEMAIRKKPVIYLNMEMSREQMLAKALSYKLAIKKGSVKKSAAEILQGYSWRDNESEKQIMTDLLEEYREKSFPYIQYNPGNVGSDLDTIINYLREVGNKARFEGEQAPAVVVDYLHLISTTKGLDVQELIKRTVTELKRYAIDYDTFVIGIVATNRSSNGSISLDSGRDSSNLEYSGDYVLSLDYWKADQSKTRLSAEELAVEQKKKYRHMIIRVLKGRLGEVGNYARVYYNAANNVFYGEHEWLPVDDERTPFDADPAGTKAKQAKNRI